MEQAIFLREVFLNHRKFTGKTVIKFLIFIQLIFYKYKFMGRRKFLKFQKIQLSS